MEFKSTPFVLVALATVLLCSTLTSASKPRRSRSCQEGLEYYNLEQKECVPCTHCADNTISHLQCFGTQDTMCLLPFGFGKFDFLQPMKSEEKMETRQATTTSQKEPEVSEQTAATLLLADEISDEKWFTITLVLAGILVVACLAVIILLLVSCYMCKRKQRDLVYDSAFAGALLGDDNSTQGKMQLFKIVTET